jgi:hypothetical protein
VSGGESSDALDFRGSLSTPAGAKCLLGEQESTVEP